MRHLYQRTMEDGFGGLTELSYLGLGWGDAEVAQLSATLREVNCAGVVTLYLSRNSELKSGEVLAGVLGQLRGLEVLNLQGCTSLSSLPDSIGQLKALRVLYLVRCTSLTSVPDFSGLPQLKVYK